MAICGTTDVLSWITCVESGLPFTEVMTVVVFLVIFMALKAYPTREGIQASLFVSTFFAASMYALNAINGVVPLFGVILTALSVVFLKSQNEPL